MNPNTGKNMWKLNSNTAKFQSCWPNTELQICKIKKKLKKRPLYDSKTWVDRNKVTLYLGALRCYENVTSWIVFLLSYLTTVVSADSLDSGHWFDLDGNLLHSLAHVTLRAYFFQEHKASLVS